MNRFLFNPLSDSCGRESLDEALERLEQDDPRKARMVMLRYFAGLNDRETAEVLGLSLRTLQREWRFVRVFLFAQLAESGTDPSRAHAFSSSEELAP